MNTTARVTSSSVSEGLPPFGGIAPLPLIASLTSSPRPSLMRGAHAVLSPSFGALATPAWWQAAHTVFTTSSPLRPPAAPPPPPAANSMRPKLSGSEYGPRKPRLVGSNPAGRASFNFWRLREEFSERRHGVLDARFIDVQMRDEPQARTRQHQHLPLLQMLGQRRYSLSRHGHEHHVGVLLHRQVQRPQAVGEARCVGVISR